MPSTSQYARTFHCIKYPLILLLLLLSQTTYSQQIKRTSYNRIQYHKYKWQAFHTAYFHIYFPRGYDSLCSYVAKHYLKAAETVKDNMGTNLLKEPNIIIYPSPDQLYESNIGMAEPELLPFPTFVIKGNRMLLAFDGNHRHLKQQLNEGIARSIWEAQVKTGDEANAGSITLNEKIPYWYKEGAIRYFANGWPIEAEDELKRSFELNDFPNWAEVINYQPRLSGQAFNYWLAREFYRQAPMQLYGQLKKKKDFYRASRLITKKPMDSLYAKCFQYYRQRFNQSNRQQSITTAAATNNSKQENTSSLTIPLKQGILKDIAVSPDKTQIAYTVSTNNKRTVYLYDSRRKETKKITAYKLPPWLNDYSKDPYPLLEWTTNGRELIVTMPVKGKLTASQYSTAGNRTDKHIMLGADGITTLLPLERNNFLLSAYRKGQSDIVTYNPYRQRYETITNDVYDDLQPEVNQENTSEIYFTSTRPADSSKRPDTLKKYQGVFSIKDKAITPIITDTIDYIKWSKPKTLQGNKLLATHTVTGTEKFAIINNPNGNPQIPTLTDYQPYQYLSQSQEIVFYQKQQDSLAITIRPLENWVTEAQQIANANDAANNNQSTNETSPWLEDYKTLQAELAKEDSILNAARKNSEPGFLSKVLVPENAKEQSEQRQDSIEASVAYSPKKVRPYILQLHSAYFSARVNNDYFINRYQPYLNYQGQFKFPEVGGMLQGGFTDLFENHHFTVAFKLPAANEGSDFFVKYRNTARKVDWELTYFRKVESLQPDPNRNWLDENGNPYPAQAKVKTHYYETGIHYPITYDWSFAATTGVRYDRTIFQATEKYSLTYPDIKSIWSITSLSTTVNKLRPTLPLLYRGMQAKLLIDIFKGFSQKEDLLAGSRIQVEYHKPIYRYITLVAQAQAGYSGGDSKILYNFGGTDNNVAPKTDTSIHFKQDAPYAFQTLVTPFRGYKQNSLYGNTFALFNADVYFPLFQSLIPIETPLPSINNLQLGVFSDYAIASETFAKPVNQQALWSYGLSARTTLAGYPIRFDIAWPGDFNQKPVWYLSLSVQ